MNPAILRRLGIFAVLFGGAMAAVYSVGDGFLTETSAPPDQTTPVDEPDGPGVRVGGGKGPQIGKGGRGGLQHDEIAYVGARPVRFRDYECKWERSTPLPTENPGEKAMSCEGFTLVLYPRPSKHRPTPRAVEGPGASRIDASTAVVIRGNAGRELNAQLRGDVVLTHYDEQGDPEGPADEWIVTTLRTEALDVVQEGPTRTMKSDRAVVIENRSAKLEGVGLEGDSGLGVVKVLSKVRGVYQTPDGEVRIRSEGPGLLEALGGAPGIAAGERRRWRTTFRDKVRVEQGATSITCNDRLVIEFRNVPGKSTAGFERFDLFEAHGDFRMHGIDAENSFEITSDHARRWREDETRDVMLLEGSPEMWFVGSLSKRRVHQQEGEEVRSRFRVRCKGPATIIVVPHPQHAGLKRLHVVFENDVVVTQEDLETGTVLTRLEAPRVTLLGDQRTNQFFDPQHLTAEGGVVMRHEKLLARSQVIAWMANRETGVQKVVLSGRPTAQFQNATLGNPLGMSEDGQLGDLLLSCTGDLDLFLYPTPEEGKPAPGRPSVSVSAKGNVHVRKVVGETEPFRLSADNMDAVFGQDRRLLSANAWGNAKLSGRGEDKAARRGEASGTRIGLTRVTGGDPGQRDWVGTAQILGHRDRTARAALYDSDGTMHLLHANEISYSENGAVVVAKRRASATIAQPVDDADGSGTIWIVATEIRAESRLVEKKDGGTETRLEGVIATGAVRLKGRSTRAVGGAVHHHEVTGDEVRFAAATGVAVVTGRPARASMWMEGGTSRVTESFIVSPRIRAEFDMSGEQRGRLLRASCDGGRFMGFLSPKDGKGVAERVRVEAAGPITVDASHGTARDDVAVIYESLTPGNRWKQDAKILCDSLDLSFDARAGGTLQNQITRMVAKSDGELPVRVTTPRIEGTADLVEVTNEDTRIHLRADPGRFVVIREKLERTRFRCDPGCSIDYRTYEWETDGRSELLPEDE